MGKTILTKNFTSFFVIPMASWLVYVTAYLGRINLSITIPFLQEELGYSKAALGFLASGFYGAYAAGQVINGALGDRVRARYFISLGLFAAGIGNIVFALYRSFPAMFFSWTLNGYFQSMLWGPLLRTISISVPAEKNRRAMFLMSTSPVAGSFFAYILAGRLAAHWRWEAAFFIPGIIFIAAAVLWFIGFPETPRKKEYGISVKNPFSFARLRLAPGQFGKFILQSKIYYLILLCVLIGIVKEGFTLWGPAIFTELYALDYTKMLSVMSFMPLANLACVILVGILINKYLWAERRVVFFFLCAAMILVFLLWIMGNVAFALVIFFYYGFLSSIYTANIVMTGYVPLYYKSSDRISSVAGITDCAIYLGAVISGPVIGTTAERFGWNGIFGGMLVICAAASFAGFLVRIPLALCGRTEKPY